MTTAEDKLVAQLDEFSKILLNDPGPLGPENAFYVPDLHGPKNEDVVLSLKRACTQVEGSAMYYFTGQRGTGKSTELRRLATLLDSGDARAFVVDALDYISDSHPIELIDLLLVVAIAFADRLREQSGNDLLKEDVGTRFANWLQTEVELQEFSKGGAKLTFKQKQQSVIQRIRRFDLARQERFQAECRDFITKLARFARQWFKRERIVLIVDSLERLRGIGAAATDMFDRVVKVFDGGIDVLRLNEVQAIYTIPPYLPYLSNVRAFVRVFSLASVRVYQPPKIAKRAPRPGGVDSMRSVVERRFGAWRDLIAPEALDRLILHSGGDLRQLLRRFLVDVVDQCYNALDRLPLKPDDAIIQTALDRHRVEFEQLVVREEYPLLKIIADKNTVDMRKREDLSAVARFFDIRAVLNYRNGVDWVDLNPLLWPLIDRYDPPPQPNAGS